MMPDALSPTMSAETSTRQHEDDAQQLRNDQLSARTMTNEKEHANVNVESLNQEQEPPMTFRRAMSFVAMAFLWTGSQIPVYLFGGIPPYIYGDIGGVDRWTWFVLANLLCLAAVCPFVGSLSDLVGRRVVAICGSAFIVFGMIICSVAKDMNVFICGMSFAGVGAGMNELTALAATSELAPTRKRGTYVAVLIFTIAPFCPSVLWGQLIAYHSTWRYVGLFCGLWSFIGLVLTFVFYNPPQRVNSKGMSRMQIVRQIDYVGGGLSMAGMILFMIGIQWGGYQYDWWSVHVLVTLLFGIALLVAFVFWEIMFAPYPMFPRRLNQEKRILSLTLVITFISGANFFSILMFWPTQAFNVYGHDPVGVGIRGLPVGFGILAGAFIVLVLLTLLKGHIRELLIGSSVLMTIGCGALAVANADNLFSLWIILIIAGLGIGGIVVPASIISTIICPDDLIATVTALTLAIRVIGGSIGYCIYYNVFVSKFIPAATAQIGGVMYAHGIVSPDRKETHHLVAEAIELTSASLLEGLRHMEGIAGNETRYEAVVRAGQVAFADAYRWVYYTSIAFGVVSILAACFLGNIRKYMDNHVAVVM